MPISLPSFLLPSSAMISFMSRRRHFNPAAPLEVGWKERWKEGTHVKITTGKVDDGGAIKQLFLLFT
jgi:hypothetical protein